AAFIKATVVFPNATIHFLSETSPQLELQKERERARPAGPSHLPGFFVAATICYEDVFNEIHYTKTCRVLGPIPTDSFGYCEMDTIERDQADAKKTCG